MPGKLRDTAFQGQLKSVPSEHLGRRLARYLLLGRVWEQDDGVDIDICYW